MSSEEWKKLAELTEARAKVCEKSSQPLLSLLLMELTIIAMQMCVAKNKGEV